MTEENLWNTEWVDYDQIDDGKTNEAKAQEDVMDMSKWGNVTRTHIYGFLLS